jgi:hypothetical protein
MWFYLATVAWHTDDDMAETIFLERGIYFNIALSTLMDACSCPILQTAPRFDCPLLQTERLKESR